MQDETEWPEGEAFMNNGAQGRTDESRVQELIRENAALREENARLRAGQEAAQAGDRRWVTILASIGDAVINMVTLTSWHRTKFFVYPF